MLCVSCHHIMTTIVETHLLNRLVYDLCDQCGGMWLDKGELDKIAMQTPGSVEASSIEEMREEGNVEKSYQPFPPNCPRCRETRMMKMHFMGEARILLDHCARCGGIWVDGGKLTKINQVIQRIDPHAKPSRFGRAKSSLLHRVHVDFSSHDDQASRGGTQ